MRTMPCIVHSLPDQYIERLFVNQSNHSSSHLCRCHLAVPDIQWSQEWGERVGLMNISPSLLFSPSLTSHQVTSQAVKLPESENCWLKTALLQFGF